MDKLISRWVAIDDMEIHRVNRRAREVTAYATFFAQPAEIRDKHGHYFEEINRSAFNRTISHGISRVQVFYNHGYDLSGRPNILGAVPIASPTSIKADSRGLLTIARYNDGEVADAVLAAWEGGQIRGQSFAGKVYADREIGERDGLPHIERTELGLREFGPTHSPAYDGDGLVMMRADLEELVRSILPTLIDPAATPSAPARGSSTGSTPPGSGTEDTDSRSHSGHARERLTLKRRRLTGGMTDAPTP